MKLSQIITDDPVKIDQLVPGGQGIGTGKEGIKGFFWNALPGETVTEYEITKKKSHYFEAIALKIENPSSHRITEKDSCYLSTSPWQIMDYAYELKQKSELLSEIFRQHFSVSSPSPEGYPNNGFAPLGKINNAYPSEERPGVRSDEDGLGVVDFVNSRRGVARSENPLGLSQKPKVQTDGNDFFYRNKMEYSLYFDHETEQLYLGFHQRGTHRKIKVETSSIERPEIFEKATEIVANLNAEHADGRKYQSLLLRCNQNGQVEGGLYENHKPHPIFNNLTDTILGKTYSYSPNGFFQINLPVYEMALKEIKQHIKTEDVLDLYAGVGTIGLSVASDKNLTLVEVDKSAFKELEKNCRQIAENFAMQGDSQQASLERARFEEDFRRAESCVPSAGCPARKSNENRTRVKQPTAGCRLAPTPILAKSEEVTSLIRPSQTVIVDPPRAGLDKKLVERLLEIMPETIIYLSCNPVTQARDVKLLLEKYQIEKVQAFNFFPRTPHLENLVILNHK